MSVIEQAERNDPPGTRPRSRLHPALPLAVVMALAALVYLTGWYKVLSFQTLVHHYEAIDAFIEANLAAAVGAYMLCYVAAVTLSLPGGAVMTTTGGFLFGMVVGGLAAIVGATAGAVVIFLVVRTALGGPIVRRAGGLTARLAKGFQDDAFSYIMFLRLTPAPFWLVNLAPALANVPLRTFFLATVIGIIPATFTFAFFGAGLERVIESQAAAYQSCVAEGWMECPVDFNLGTVMTPQLIAALAFFCILAMVPMVWKQIKSRRRAQACD